MARIAMWCPCFVMYNHNQLVIMKKVLLALFALLALASCSKEANEPKGKESAGATTPIYVDVSGEVSSPRALDFVLKDGLPKVSLDGRTTVPVWTFIYAGDRLIYSEWLDWKVKDGKKIYYQGDLPIPATYGYSNITLIAIIAGDRDDPDTKLIGNQLHSSILLDQKIHQLGSATSPINVPYKMEFKLDYRSQAPQQLHSGKLPAQVRKFRPMGAFLKFKIRNELDQAVDINTFMSYLFTPKTAFIVTEGEQRGKLYFTNQGDGTPGGFGAYQEYEFADGTIHINAHSVSNETFLVWLPTFYYHHKDPYRIAGNQKVELIVTPTTSITEGYYTDMSSFLTREQSDYQEGHIYLGELALRSFKNPLERISDSPLDRTGEKFVDNSGGYPATFDQVGYFNKENVRNRFTQPRTYSGGTGQWYLPTALEMNSIFPGYTIFAGTTKHDEFIQIGNHFFVSYAYYKRVIRGASPSDFEWYGLRFCQVPAKPASYGTSMSNSKRYAFRYRYSYNGGNSLYTVQAKYVGADPAIQTVDDIQDISLGGKIDWATVTPSKSFPAYGADPSLNRINSPAAPKRTSVYSWVAPSVGATTMVDKPGSLEFTKDFGNYCLQNSNFYPDDIGRRGGGRDYLGVIKTSPVYLFKK